VFGDNFNVSGTALFKCRFSHNMYEVAGRLVLVPQPLGKRIGAAAAAATTAAVVCVSPQGKAFSTVQVCVASKFGATDYATIGCANGWTANEVLFFHYTLFPLVRMRPTSGPSVGGFQVVISLYAQQQDQGYVSGAGTYGQFRSYSSKGALCRFGVGVVPATVVNATRITVRNIKPPHAFTYTHAAASPQPPCRTRGTDSVMRTHAVHSAL
jgi:hypothetical protein